MTAYLFIPVFVVFMFAAFAALIALLWYVHWRYEKARREKLEAYAAQQGWAYTQKDTRDRPERYRHFEPFGKGHSRYAYNILGGTQDDAAFEIFDYHYAITTHNGKSSQTQHYYNTVCTLRMPMHAPGLTIKKEHIGHKLINRFADVEINFESHEFSRRHWVTCSDRRFAYDVIHPLMMEYLLQNPGWHWQWRGHTLLVHKKGRLNPQKALQILRASAGFRERLPRHLHAQTTPRATGTQTGRM